MSDWQLECMMKAILLAGKGPHAYTTTEIDGIVRQIVASTKEGYRIP